MKKIIGYMIMLIVAICIMVNIWWLSAALDMLFVMSCAILSGLAWEEWQDLKARRANARRNIELSRR